MVGSFAYPRCKVGGHIPVPLPDDDDDDDVDAKKALPRDAKTSSNDLVVHTTKARDHHHRVTHERVVLVVAIVSFSSSFPSTTTTRSTTKRSLSLSFLFLWRDSRCHLGSKSSPQFASHFNTTKKARKTCRSLKREREREESSSSLSFPKKKASS